MKKSKIILIIMPLFLIGAFFLDIFFKFLIFFFSLFILTLYDYRLFFKSIKVLVGIFISILPFLISFLFTYKEGKIFYIFGIKFYSYGLLKMFNYLFNILIVGLFSFILVKVFNIFKILRNKRFSVLFLSIEFYSGIISDFFKDFKKFKFSKIVNFIDEKYIYFKNINRQSDES
ncbi:MAG: hypothetical protein WHS77_02055 [Brevinematales bacterium]